MASFTENLADKSNEYIIQILQQAEEYNPEFVSLAAAQLKARNIDTSSYILANEQKMELEDQKIASGVRGNPVHITICFISALLGGILGIIAGTMYSFGKKTDSKGVKHYQYDLETRKKGHKILFLGLFVFFGVLFWRMGI